MKKVLVIMGISLCWLLTISGLLFSVASLPLILYWCGNEYWYVPLVAFPFIPFYACIPCLLTLIILYPLYYIVIEAAKKNGMENYLPDFEDDTTLF